MKMYFCIRKHLKNLDVINGWGQKGRKREARGKRAGWKLGSGVAEEEEVVQGNGGEEWRTARDTKE